MENLALFPEPIVAARNHRQQLKVLMNLPVRLVSENQTIDVLPLQNPDGTLVNFKKRKVVVDPLIFPTPNELIQFFKGCQENDLLNTTELAKIYSVDRRTITRWSAKGILIRYMLASGLTLFKRSELPTIEQIYGPYES